MSYSYLSEVESNARTYANTFKCVFTTGQGIRIQNADGQEFIDCLANAGSLPLGHNHPGISEAVASFVTSNKLQQALDLTTQTKIDFVQTLFGCLPPKMSQNARIHFCGPTGSDAVEAAFKLARFYTGRQKILAFHGAYHGMTSGALGAMGNLLPKSSIGSAASDVQFLPYPYRYRCPFGTDGSYTDQLSLNYIRNILSDPESGVAKPAAIILEVVQGEGGSIPASNEWLRGIREITLEFEIPLIIDEVQTGLGRTGKLFAIEHAGITPEILVLSKAIGGGYPLSVIVYDQQLDVWPSGMHAGTFRGNQIAMLAGSKTIQIIEQENLTDHARVIGQLLRDGIANLANQYPIIGDIRGRGLMLGVEIIHPSDTQAPGAPNGALARIIKQNCFKHGLIIETGGRHGCVLRFLPPLITSNNDVAEILTRLELALRDSMVIYRQTKLFSSFNNSPDPLTDLVLQR